MQYNYRGQARTQHLTQLVLIPMAISLQFVEAFCWEDRDKIVEGTYPMQPVLLSRA